MKEMGLNIKLKKFLSREINNKNLFKENLMENLMEWKNKIIITITTQTSDLNKIIKIIENLSLIKIKIIFKKISFKINQDRMKQIILITLIFSKIIEIDYYEFFEKFCVFINF